MEFLPEGKALGSTSGSTFLLAHANLDVIVTKANKQLFINLSNHCPLVAGVGRAGNSRSINEVWENYVWFFFFYIYFNSTAHTLTPTQARSSRRHISSVSSQVQNKETNGPNVPGRRKTMGLNRKSKQTTCENTHSRWEKRTCVWLTPANHCPRCELALAL